MAISNMAVPKESHGQLLAVMLQSGTPCQVLEALVYLGHIPMAAVLDYCNRLSRLTEGSLGVEDVIASDTFAVQVRETIRGVYVKNRRPLHELEDVPMSMLNNRLQELVARWNTNHYRLPEPTFQQPKAARDRAIVQIMHKTYVDHNEDKARVLQVGIDLERNINMVVFMYLTSETRAVGETLILREALFLEQFQEV